MRDADGPHERSAPLHTSLYPLVRECPLRPPADKQNENPVIYASTVRRRCDAVDDLESDAVHEPIDALEVFELIRHLNDPEHPLTLEQLNVTSIDGVVVDDANSTGEW